MRPWIIKAGGELLAAPSTRRKLLRDLSSLHKKHPVVFVHGGGPQIEKALVKSKIAAKFVAGRRVTSKAAMAVVESVLSGQINKGIAADLSFLGAAAIGLSGRDGKLITARTIPRLGRAARPEKISPRVLAALLAKKILPVVSSVASDASGKPVNVNADDAASALAVAMKAARLVFLTNVSGVRGAGGKRIAILRTRAVQRLIKGSIITGGMIPKVQSAVAAIKKGVGEVDIVNGAQGINWNQGTRIVR